ncbi:MAG: aminotransferase class I/II-fold pyridoxal phosphate-dependent enzyme [Nocardioidaceae bacterium]|nr:aminotransferase class I/II-fold pyridoxal phosphate-dependent enzyme [Nocardioidaceae bacterium]
MANPLEALTVEQLRRRTSLKWRAYDADVLPLWVAEMDVLLAEPVATAITDAVGIGDTGYPAGVTYAEALAEFAATRWGWQLDTAHTAIVPDVMLGVVEVLKLVTSPGDAVVVNSPVYTPFYLFVEHMDRRVIEAPLSATYRIDLGRLETAFAAAVAGGRSAAYLLCSPHNPTGTVHTRAELLAVAGLAARHGVRVVVDEIHSPLVYADATHTPYLALPGTESAFAVLSASKAWNLAGVKAAVAVAGEVAAADLARMPEEVSHGASHLGIIAHAAGLRHGVGWLDELLAGLDSNRHLLGELLADMLPGVRYRPPQGTFLAWLDCRSLDLDGDAASIFLERGRVAVMAGAAFGTGGEGYVRLNLATPPQILRQAVQRMAEAVATR